MIRLQGEDYHYLVNVRRLKPGSIFTALLPCNSVIAAITVLSIDEHTLTGSAEFRESEESGGARESIGFRGSGAQETAIPPIVLFQSLPKGSKMDLIIRQAAEGGISEIVPFVSEHSVPRNLSRDGRMERWQRIVKEARQQSGSAVNTRVLKTLTVDELFSYWEKLQAETSRQALGLILTDPLAQASFHQYLYTRPPLVVLAVGPEGGFSRTELSRFAESGFKPLSLGENVLRTETAALCGAAAVKIILMERKWWTLKQ